MHENSVMDHPRTRPTSKVVIFDTTACCYNNSKEKKSCFSSEKIRHGRYYYMPLFKECAYLRLVHCEARHKKTCLCHANNKSSLISAFVVRYLDSIIPILAKSKISRLQLVSVAEQAGLSLTWWQSPKTDFLVTWHLYFSPSDRTTSRGRLSVASNWSGGFSVDLTYRDYL